MSKKSLSMEEIVVVSAPVADADFWCADFDPSDSAWYCGDFDPSDPAV